MNEQVGKLRKMNISPAKDTEIRTKAKQEISSINPV